MPLWFFNETGRVTTSFVGTTASVASSANFRYALATISWFGGGATPRTLVSATMAGVTASILIQDSYAVSGSTIGNAIIAAFIPSGTSGAITPTFSGAVILSGVAVYDVTGWNGASSGGVLSQANPASFSLAVPDNGAAVAVVDAQNNLTTDPPISSVWANLTQDSSVIPGTARYYSSASKNFAAASSFTATCTITHTGISQDGVAVVLTP